MFVGAISFIGLSFFLVYSPTAAVSFFKVVILLGTIFIVSKNIYFCIVGPEAPLADGLINSLEEAGIPCFGPRKEAAQLESSKTFAKQIMNEAGVPTAQSKYFDNDTAVFIKTR